MFVKIKKSVRLGLKSSILNSLYVISREKAVEREGKCYFKIKLGTGCKVMIQFELTDEGYWLVVRYEIYHDDVLCLESQRHLLRSQRSITKNQFKGRHGENFAYFE